MKVKFNILIITFISFCLNSFDLQAQWTLDIVGTVKKEENNKRLEGATITVKKNGSVYKTFTSPANGKFEFSLEPNADYMIEFSKPGHVTKRIFASTKNVPPEDAKYGFEFSFEMNLFENIEGLDVSILNKPIAKIQFNPSTGYIDYDPEYTKSIQKELEKLKAELERRLKEQEEERKRKQKAYDDAIAAGDKAFNSNNFETAKTEYKKASAIFPDEGYPKDQLDLIEQKLKEQAALNKKYNDLIASADESFNKKDYQAAIATYQEALSVKPNEKYPQTKITEAKKLLEQLQAQEEKYKELIQNADNAFGNEEWESAGSFYNKALEIKPNEAYPKQKIAEIEQKLKAIQEKNKAYNDAIAAGEQLFKENKLEAALEKYQQAKEIKPEEDLPQTKIDEIKALIADQKAKQQAFDNLMASAKSKFDNKAYEEALSLYKEANELLPNEPLPKQKIEEINNLLAEIAKKEADAKALEEKYQALIETADEFYNDEKWNEAKTKYQEALDLKSDENYPANQIKLIDEKLAEIAAIEKQYNDLIAAADNLFNQKNYENAKAKYQEALTIKKEQYPQNKIDEIEGILEDLANKKEKEAALEANYKALIAEADNLFDNKSYEEAKDKYLKAIGLKNETYPNNRVKEIENILAEIQKQKDQEELAKEAERKKREYYESLIAQADAELDNQELEKAKKTYTDASNVLPEESYPKEKLKEIDDLIKKREEALKNKEQIDENYSSLILEADKYFDAQKFENAISKYQEALTLKPNEQYPKEQIEKARLKIKELEEKKKQEEALSAAMAQKQEQYDNFIKKADESFNQNEYNDALNNYQKALSIMPNESYPKQKIDEINKLLKDLENQQLQEQLAQQEAKAKKEKYDQLIFDADRKFKLKDYESAKSLYQEALNLFPNEIYPKDKIKEIEDILANQATENIIVTNNNANKNDGSYSVDPTKEAEIEKMIAEMRAEKEKAKYEALEKDVKGYKEQQKIYITGSVKRINDNEKVIDELEKESKNIKKEGNKKHLDNANELEKDKITYKSNQDAFQDNAKTRIDNNREELTDLADKSRKIIKDGSSKHLEKAKQLALEKNGYKSSIEKLNDHQAKQREKNQELLIALEEQIKKLNQMRDKRAQQYAKELESFRETIIKAKHQRTINQQKFIENQNKELKKLDDEMKKMRTSHEKSNLKNAQKVEKEKEVYENQNQKMMDKGQKIIVRAQKENDKQAEQIKKFNDKANKEYYKKIAKMPDYKKDIADQEYDRILKSEKKRQENLKQINKEKNYTKELQENNKASYLKHVENIRKEKERVATFNSDMQAVNKEKISNVDFNYYKGEKKLSEDPELASKYKQGITEETIKGDNYITLKRTKVVGNHVDVYEKIYFTWGGTFYKKNGVDVNKEIWDNEAFK